MKNCLNCLNCKIKKSVLTLRCRIPIPLNGKIKHFSNWFNESGDERIIKICPKNEVHKIKYRELFGTAKYCKYFEIDTLIQETP